MFVPLMEIEGTRDEVVAKLLELNGHRLRVSVEVEDKAKPNTAEEKAQDELRLSDEKAERRLAKFQAIVARISQREPSKPDTRDWLREGRAGGMFGFEPTE